MFAILFEVLLIEIQEEIHHFAGWEGGGLRGAKIVNKNFVNKLAFPNCCCLGQGQARTRPSRWPGVWFAFQIKGGVGACPRTGW